MEESSRVETTKETSIYELSEDCMTQILSLTSPQDLCNVCQVSKILKHDSELDSVWNTFLPLDYKDLIADEVLNQFRLKKELFSRLCTSYVDLKGENRTMSIDKITGKKTFMIGSREVVFSDIGKFVFWRWVADDTSRFGEVAELAGGNTFFISCRVDTRILSPKTTYAAYFVLKNKEIKDTYEFYPESSANVKFVEHDDATCSRRIYIKVYGYFRAHNVNDPQQFYFETIEEDYIRMFMSSGEYMGTDLRYPVDRDNGWLEVDLGDFYNNEGENGVIEVSVVETTDILWMKGLLVEGIEWRPKLNGRPN